MKKAALQSSIIEAPTVVEAIVSAPVIDSAIVEAPISEDVKLAPPAQRVAAIKAAVIALAGDEDVPVLFKEWNGGNSFAVRLPSFKTAVKNLPQSDESKQYLTVLKNLRASVESFTNGSASQTWVFHKSGSFALYSSL